MITGLSRVIGAVAAAAVLVFATDSRAEPCDNPVFGLRACDQSDSECPVRAMCRTTGRTRRRRVTDHAEKRNHRTGRSMYPADALGMLLLQRGRERWLHYIDSRKKQRG
jgi:hypothetical protein